MLIETGDCGPYSASSVRPATIVGSANGRSITALTIDLPRNSSRTSTQAVIVPKSALTSDTIAAAPSVSFSAASASGEVATDQNWPSPFFCDAHTSAAIGRITITDKN